MKTAIEKVGKLAVKTRRAKEHGNIGPTVVDLAVLEAILEVAAGQGAIVERLQALEEWLADEERRRGERERAREVADDRGDAPDLASRVASLEANRDADLNRKRIIALEEKLRGVLDGFADEPAGGEGTS